MIEMASMRDKTRVSFGCADETRAKLISISTQVAEIGEGFLLLCGVSVLAYLLFRVSFSFPFPFADRTNKFLRPARHLEIAFGTRLVESCERGCAPCSDEL